MEDTLWVTRRSPLWKRSLDLQMRPILKHGSHVFEDAIDCHLSLPGCVSC